MIIFIPMKSYNLKVSWLTLVLMTGLLIGIGSMIAREGETRQPYLSETQEKSQTDSIPDLIALSTEVYNRSTVLKKEIASLGGLSQVQKKMAQAAKEIEQLSISLGILKNTEGYNYDQLFDIRARINQKTTILQELIQSINELIRQAEQWKKEWKKEDTQWKHLQSTLSGQTNLATLETTFTRVFQTINQAQTDIACALEPMLAQLQAAQIIQASQSALRLELDALASNLDGSLLHKTARSMFSSRYYSLLNQSVWKDLPKSLHPISRPDIQFFNRYKWLVIIQVLFSLILSAGIFQQRDRLMERQQWQFIASRPFEAGIFIAAITTSLFYGAVPGIWRLLSQCIVIISLARLVDAFVANLYQKRIWLVYGLSACLITTRLFVIVDLPQPLLRLYIFSTAFIGMFFCHWYAAAGAREKEPILYVQALRLGSLGCLLIVLAEMGGYSALSSHLLESSLKTILVVLAGWMMMVMLHGFLEWALYSPPFKKMPFLEMKTQVIINRSALLANLFAATLTGTFILVVWRVYDNPADAIQAVWSFGMTLGSRHISIGLVLTAAAILYGAFLISWTVQALLMEGVFDRRNLQVGVRLSMARLIHYSFVCVGFLLALIRLGAQLRDFTIIAGALGVGIGFGLQGIINNFVSGLILLFERPVKVGDYIELGEHQAEIKKIGLRSTIVRTFDRSEIVVPNSDLIANQVTNLTLSDQYSVIKVPMSVAHGSDVPLVMNTLLECANEHNQVEDYPAPQVLFKGYGKSALDFELLVWLVKLDNMFQVKSDLYQNIDHKFGLQDIQVPYPQHDLHVRMVDKSEPAFPLESKDFFSSPFTKKKKDKIHVF